MIKIEVPKNPTYTVTLIFEDLTYDQLENLHTALGGCDYHYSQEEFSTLSDFLFSRGPQ